MSIPVVKFNNQDKPEFIKELRKKVNRYFKDNNITKYGNSTMHFKTVFMLCLYLVPLLLMISGVVTSLWPVMGMWFLMAFGMSGIGLSIMHDANHEAYSKKKKINKYLGFLMNFLGSYHITWKIQHNVLHHSFTNVEGFDEDIEIEIMRFSPTQERKKGYKFQAFYGPFLYGFMTIYKFLIKDFQQLVKYDKMGLLAGQGLTLKKAMRNILVIKTLYIVFTLVLPIVTSSLPWWQMLLGFTGMHFICGLLLAFIFQSAHVLEETSFYEADENNSVENHWAILQMNTTANFAHNSKFFSWFIGGLNYQVEHHLFPNICHVHYKHISKIVKETANQYDVPYHEHKTFFGAIRSHFALLHDLGTGKYDIKKKAADAAKMAAEKAAQVVSKPEPKPVLVD